MKLQHLFTANLFVAIFFGLSCTFFIDWVARLYGLEPDPAAVWSTRLAGGSILGFASLMWFGQKSANRDTRRAIALALLIQDIVGLAASLEIQISGVVNAFGWTSPLLYGLLAVGYSWFLFVKPDAS